MANYIATARSNYFLVKSLTQFMQSLPDGITVHVREIDARVAVFADTDDGSWPACFDDDDGEPAGVDIVQYVADHLVDDEVAVFFEIGAEKMRYLVGIAECVNNKNERRYLSLPDIYKVATELGPNVTLAES